MRIVIVEDEVKIREGMGKMIESHTGHRIVGEASDGEEGLQMVLRLRPDLVITDIRMPRMNGLRMLEEIARSNVSVHSVILSGYSEFEYVQKAIRYGADDYLLKPLAADDVKHMLETVEQRIQKERASVYGQPESRIRDLLFGNVEESEKVVREMYRACGFEPDTKYELMAGYIGNCDPKYKNDVEEAVDRLRKAYREYKIYLFCQEDRQIIFCLTAGKSLEGQEKKRYENVCYNALTEHVQKDGESAVWARVDCTEKNLRKAGKHLEEGLAYGLVMEPESWITDEMIENYCAETYEYPLEIGKQLRASICRGDNEEIEKAGEAFLSFMSSRHYTPADMRYGFRKSYRLVNDALQDIDQTLHEHLENSGAWQQIESALTFSELRDVWENIIRMITGGRVKREDISNYIIERAIAYIREHYQEEITQEELSRKLEITPEYLSALFKREVGIGFSVFLKKFRISHAKRLLKGTDLKIYEIAERTGYSDAKYFAKVFKEELGITPGEYRQMD